MGFITKSISHLFLKDCNYLQDILSGLVLSNLYLKKVYLAGVQVLTLIFEANNLASFNPQHTHNLPLEIALSYGIPASLIIIFSLLF